MSGLDWIEVLGIPPHLGIWRDVTEISEGGENDMIDRVSTRPFVLVFFFLYISANGIGVVVVHLS